MQGQGLSGEVIARDSLIFSSRKSSWCKGLGQECKWRRDWSTERDAKLQVMGPAVSQSLLMRNAGCPPTAIRSFGEVEAREYLTLCGTAVWGTPDRSRDGNRKGSFPPAYTDQGANSHRSCGQGIFAAGQLGLGCHRGPAHHSLVLMERAFLSQYVWLGPEKTVKLILHPI